MLDSRIGSRGFPQKTSLPHIMSDTPVSEKIGGCTVSIGGYVPLFTIAAPACLLALLVMQWLSPRLETVKPLD